MPDLRVAVDAGGTFTDVCIYNSSTQDFHVTKVPSTPNNPMQAVLDGVKRGEIDLADVELFFHGTTVATNMVIERNGAENPDAEPITPRGDTRIESADLLTVYSATGATPETTDVFGHYEDHTKADAQ